MSFQCFHLTKVILLYLTKDFIQNQPPHQHSRRPKYSPLFNVSITADQSNPLFNVSISADQSNPLFNVSITADQSNPLFNVDIKAD